MEFEQSKLMHREINVGELLGALKRRMKLLITVMLVIFTSGVLLAVMLPTIYRSEAVILIEKQEIPSDMVRSTVTSFAEQRIQVLSQHVMSSSSLIEIIEKYDLYRDARERDPREVIVEEMRSNISLKMISADVVDPRSGKPTEATIAFSLSFEDQSAAKAQRVVNELVTSFLDANIRSRTESAMETTSFLNDESEALRARVSELEAAIAKFKDENAYSRPELEGVTRDMMNRAEFHLSEVDRRINETIQHKIYLEAELARFEPVRQSGPRGATAEDQLWALEAQLSAAEAAYGDSHPDVIRLRKQSEAMRATVDPKSAREYLEEQTLAAQSEVNGLLQRYDKSHPDVDKATRNLENTRRKLDALPPLSEQTPNNPAYVALAARLDASKSELQSLEVKRTQLLEKLEEYSERLMSIPDAEAQFLALHRDYETALGKYREISAKQLEAKVSQNLEAERKGEKFTLIEPPLLPEEAAKPNRPAIVAISFVLSVVGGLGAARLAEAMDDKIRGRQQLQDIFGAPPLAYIPVMDAVDDRHYVRRFALPIGGTAMICIAGMVVIHTSIIPIDVMWFMLLRKLGL